MENNKIAIVMPTFWRKDEESFRLTKRAILSIKRQTHQNFKLFLIGDKYEKQKEFDELSQLLDKDKIYAENIPVAVEREKYTGVKLWVTGGINASNTAIDRAVEQGFSWIAFLDYDDYYYTNHIEIINKTLRFRNTNFVSTLSWQGNDKVGRYLPELKNIRYGSAFSPYRPEVNHLSKISVCFNVNYYNVRFRNMIEEFDRIYASDGDLWNQIKAQMGLKAECGILANWETCRREGGKLVVRKPEVI